MTTLTDLEAAGAYVVAGFVDIFTPAGHKRLAQLTAGGDLVLTPEGEAFVARLSQSGAPTEVEQENPVEVKAKQAAKVKPAADAPPPEAPAPDSAGEDTNLADELGALTGQLGS